MIDILIPVLRRPRRVKPLVRNIQKVTTEPHRILFLCSQGDEPQIRACRETLEDVCVLPFEAGHGDFAKKINKGFELTEGEFILAGADDLVFHKRWDIEALEVAESSTAGVIGTNDLHNPRVIQGRHSTHPLVRRAYIEEWGGTIDGTGDVFCELYSHQYVDDELVQTALYRHQWAFAKDSHVEHLHPHFGGRAMDKTYEKAFRDGRTDQQLFSRRLNLIRRRVPRERLLHNRMKTQ